MRADQVTLIESASQWMMRVSFKTAESVAASRRLLRRESWIEGRSLYELTDVPVPSGAPSTRARSARTWNG